MSNDRTVAARPCVPHTIRRLALPILLFWVALAAITNIAVPQLEEVGKTHNVALNSPDAPSLKAIKRIGQAFHEFDTDSSAMIVLEGDKPLGAGRPPFYDEMVRKLEQDKKHVEHVQDFWGDTLTAAGSQSTRRQGRLRPGVSRGQSRLGVSQRSRRRRARHRRPHATAAGCQGLCDRRGAAHLGSVRRGQQGDRKGHRDHHRGDRVDVVFRLPLGPHHAAGARDGPHRNVRRPGTRRLSRQRRDHRAVDLRDESPDAVGDRRRNGLRDIFRRPLPGSARAGEDREKPLSTPCFAGPPTLCWVRG